MKAFAILLFVCSTLVAADSRTRRQALDFPGPLIHGAYNGLNKFPSPLGRDLGGLSGANAILPFLRNHHDGNYIGYPPRYFGGNPYPGGNNRGFPSTEYPSNGLPPTGYQANGPLLIGYPPNGLPSSGFPPGANPGYIGRGDEQFLNEDAGLSNGQFNGGFERYGDTGVPPQGNNFPFQRGNNGPEFAASQQYPDAGPYPNGNNGPQNVNGGSNYNQGQNFNAPQGFNGGQNLNGGPNPNYNGGQNFNGGPNPNDNGGQNFNGGPNPNSNGGQNLNGGPNPNSNGGQNFNGGPNPNNNGGQNFNGGPNPNNNGGQNFNGGPNPNDNGGQNFNGGPNPNDNGGQNFNGGPNPNYNGGQNFNGPPPGNNREQNPDGSNNIPIQSGRDSQLNSGPGSFPPSNGPNNYPTRNNRALPSQALRDQSYVNEDGRINSNVLADPRDEILAYLSAVLRSRNNRRDLRRTVDSNEGVNYTTENSERPRNRSAYGVVGNAGNRGELYAEAGLLNQGLIQRGRLSRSYRRPNRAS